ncbi:DNA internalization-related competence protein ComEC/Rec2 [Paenibacillus sp. SC116]|uniref:DNA internalization-related competence protein ComEC/Rec2 n=1 Tax=Paenibacillus sp. SC116 TaxID=2968986 RepID=UPI00215A1559|nr:DNA internalization-related competence protein ComEC/Rec2 [Paenibacillus sp. SC116]MCR8845842.1 DNA internalization-related competence protein ComEC/Rec2 [Paenibacillus sp. SC116]
MAIERRPIVTAACCWMFGIYFAITMAFVDIVWSLIGLGLLLPLLDRLKWLYWKVGCLCLLVMFVSASYYYWYDSKQVSEFPMLVDSLQDDTQETEEAWSGKMEGTIASGVERDGDRVQFRLKVSSFDLNHNRIEPTSELVFVQVKLLEEVELQSAAQWKRGANISLEGELKLPSDADNFGVFDYRSYLKHQHIYGVFQVKGAQSVQMHGLASTLDWQRWMGVIEQLRLHSASQFDALFPVEQSSYLQGLILGLRSDLDLELERSFSQLGLTHVLAISGLHVAVFVGGCLYLLRLFRLSKESALTAVIVLVPLYVLFTGASPSILRAGFMSILVLIGLRQGWLRDGLHILSAVLLMMLLWNPYYAVDVSFQLSFAVTGGLIIGVPLFTRLLPVSWPLWLTSSLAVSIVAQAVSFPLTIYYFNQVSFLSLGVNLLLVPFISLVILPLGTIVLLLSYLYMPLAEGLAVMVRIGNEWTFAIVHHLAQWEGTSVIWPKLSAAWILGYYILLFVVLKLVASLRQNHTYSNYPAPNRLVENEALIPDTMPLPHFVVLQPISRRPTYVGLVCSVCLLSYLLYAGYHAGRPEETVVSFLNVGQGDSILVRTASGRNILIDGGGEIKFGKAKEAWKQRRDPYEVGEKRIVPLLKQRGVRHLDAVVVTHGDADHAGGLRAVLKHIPTDRLVMNGTWKSSSVMRELYSIALDRHISIIGWNTGTSWQVDQKTRIDVWHPSSSTAASNLQLMAEDEQNEFSLVLLLTLGEGMSKSTFLLTGDIGADEEMILLMSEKEREQKGNPYPDRIDVLKVAHHGSRSSTIPEWVDRWKPSASVISAGKNNRYGHPHPQVLRELARVHSAIFRTDLNGEVQYKSTNVGLKMRMKRDRIAQ